MKSLRLAFVTTLAQAATTLMAKVNTKVTTMNTAEAVAQKIAAYEKTVMLNVSGNNLNIELVGATRKEAGTFVINAFQSILEGQDPKDQAQLIAEMQKRILSLTATPEVPEPKDTK